MNERALAISVHDTELLLYFCCDFLLLVYKHKIRQQQRWKERKKGSKKETIILHKQYVRAQKMYADIFKNNNNVAYYMAHNQAR